ncbi:phosphoglucosamine mutase [Candidatus Marinimicrobia bacterium]|nr:phosphoglucosamine mutase [Candidatus Neomarinimicrobiota bacterium]
MELIKSVSGIRGIYNKSLHLNDISKYGYAFSELQKQSSLPILIARDSRQSGLKITTHLIDALLSIGRDVIDCDIIPTPTAQLIVDKFEIAGAIIITASHNPQEWNGMKFIDDNGTFLDKIKNEELFNLADNRDFNIKNVDIKGKKTNYLDAIDFHIKNIFDIDFIDIKKIQKKQFKIVLDTINGASCYGFKKLLEELNCEVIHVNDIPNGIFLRNPEPKTENLSEISPIVLENSADLAFVTDPDGDRLAVLDNKGEIIIEENTLVICADEVLSRIKTQKPVVTNLSTTSALDDIALKYNNKVIRTAVGEINVVKEMMATNATIGGEGNGGVILPQSHYGRDAFVGAIIILNHLAENNITLNDVSKKLPKYFMLKEKIDLAQQVDLKKIISIVKKNYTDCTFDERDGVKVISNDYWIHIRKSNTEPILRIYIESKNEALTHKLFSNLKYLF